MPLSSLSENAVQLLELLALMQPDDVSEVFLQNAAKDLKRDELEFMADEMR